MLSARGEELSNDIDLTAPIMGAHEPIEDVAHVKLDGFGL